MPVAVCSNGHKALVVKKLCLVVWVVLGGLGVASFPLGAGFCSNPDGVCSHVEVKAATPLPSEGVAYNPHHAILCMHGSTGLKIDVCCRVCCLSLRSLIRQVLLFKIQEGASMADEGGVPAAVVSEGTAVMPCHCCYQLWHHTGLVRSLFS